MAIKTHTSLRSFCVVFFLLTLIMLPACNPKESASKPFPGLKEWDLLVISSSFNWGVGPDYAKLIETDMNVKVNVHDCWVGSLEIATALKTLQSGKYLSPYTTDQSCFRPWSELIKEAEVMILFGGPQESSPPDGSWNIPEVFHSCYNGGYEGKNSQPGFKTYKEKLLNSCAPETFVTYKAHLGTFLDEIDKIREGRPLILRMTDLYIATHSSWIENGVSDVCTTCVGNTSEAIRQIATDHGVPVASTMIGFNGIDYMVDPPAEYFMIDGHLTDAGSQFVASLLQQTGYEYAGK